MSEVSPAAESTFADSSESIAIVIVRTVADAEGVDPVALEPPLHDAVDPDALESLFPDGADGVVRFEYCGHEVAVSSDGVVTLTEPAP